MDYFPGQRVEHIQTGSEGTVVGQTGPDTVEVNWDANMHGGYISDEVTDEIRPA